MHGVLGVSPAQIIFGNTFDVDIVYVTLAVYSLLFLFHNVITMRTAHLSSHDYIKALGWK